MAVDQTLLECSLKDLFPIRLLRAEGESVRLRTALGILEHIEKYIEFEKLESRIEAIERSIRHERD